jgi:hypothetical protein
VQIIYNVFQFWVSHKELGGLYRLPGGVRIVKSGSSYRLGM